MATGARGRANRTDRARATRERVIDAAGPLFVEHGYLETTMADLAAAAGVAVQTLYLSFGSKVAVLEAALDAVRHDHPSGSESSPRDGLDGVAAVAGHVARTVAVVEHRYPLDAVLRGSAADPETAALLRASRLTTLAEHARAVDDMAELPGFTDRLSLQRATDVVAAVLSPETYGLLVVEQGWTPPDWAEWAVRHLVVDLFPGAH